MLRLYRRKKAGPRYINGHLIRESGMACSLCLAAPNQWCEPGCAALDVMDYR
jgi:hypothetical protein